MPIDRFMGVGEVRDGVPGVEVKDETIILDSSATEHRNDSIGTAF
jgi:hypothetical protein